MNSKTSDQIKRMREAGLLLWETHMKANEMITPGVTTKEIDAVVESFIKIKKALPLFKGVPCPTKGYAPFPAATCISINEQVVHGIPSDKTISDGDIVSLDIGIKLNGWCADAAVTYAVGNSVSKEVQNLLQVTESCLRKDIELLKTKSMWSMIVKHSASIVHQAGFSIIEELTGHGIGKEMWEFPLVTNYVPDTRYDFRIREGMVIAIEPMINMGKKSVTVLDDGWTYVTTDGLPAAHFEHTVAITETGPEVLTCGPNGEGWAMS